MWMHGDTHSGTLDEHAILRRAWEAYRLACQEAVRIAGRRMQARGRTPLAQWALTPWGLEKDATYFYRLPAGTAPGNVSQHRDGSFLRRRWVDAFETDLPTELVLVTQTLDQQWMALMEWLVAEMTAAGVDLDD